jgi:hypothetical protein
MPIKGTHIESGKRRLEYIRARTQHDDYQEKIRPYADRSKAANLAVKMVEDALHRAQTERERIIAEYLSVSERLSDAMKGPRLEDVVKRRVALGLPPEPAEWKKFMRYA